MNTYLAIDIGASSMRGILGWMEGNRLQMQEVYRQPNGATTKNGHLCWDLSALYQGILASLKCCRTYGKCPDYMGIDTWAVDYVLLDENDQILGECVAYRDSRTDGMDTLLEETLPFSRHYALTGIAKQPFNTVYQLMAQFRTYPQHRQQAKSFLMVPDYLGFLLTGEKQNEYTNASSTGLLDAATGEWSTEVLLAAQIPAHLFKNPPAQPGTMLGKLRSSLSAQLGFDVTVLLPATHDTGSAFVAVPARDEQAVYLSSGTWSLLGTEIPSPNTEKAARLAGFTNEGGYDRKIRFLKNIMGLWMLQCIQRELDEQYSFAEMAELAASAEAYPGRVDVTDNRFLAPPNMMNEVKQALSRQGFGEPSLPELLSCVNHSLADCYAEAIRELEALLGQKFTSVNIVGGGSQNQVLNCRTAGATGLPVFAGPGEGTALGNLLVQMIAAGEVADLASARTIIKNSFTIKEVSPC